MCGILGIISTRPDELDDAAILRMRDTMVARGPDQHGYFREGEIALAHRRLSIRDQANGRQPWLTQDGRYALVYNGEIYNDAEIAKDLNARGVQLRTQCDTEVLAAAWSVWGPDCVQKLRGMFAFGIVDRISNETWLVRDRCGIKPIFYSMIDGQFVFASSIAAIRKHPRFSSQPNFAAISHYLQTLRITLGRQTVFENIYTLLPAEMVRCKDRALSHQIYWSPPLPNQDIGFEDAVEDLQETLSKSVKLRLKSDVEVGMMMSGGVDSNTLATMTRSQLQREVVGVCGGGQSPKMADETGSDFEYARACATEFGFDYSEVRVDSQCYLETWQALVQKQETPLSTPTDPIIFQIAKRLKQSVGVALGGEGADEAFCGYAIPHWSGSDFERSKAFPKLGGTKSTEFRQSLMTQYGRDEFESISDHYLSSNGLIPWNVQLALFQPHIMCEEDNQSVRHHYQGIFADCGDLPMVEKYARVLHQVNLESLLRRLDTATMTASLEARVPYADHVLVEKAFQLPHHFKIDICPNESKPWLGSWDLAKRGSLRTKRVLRAVASRLMPKRFALRPKMSFPTPVNSWLAGSWGSWIEKKLNQSDFAKELFRAQSLQELKRLPDPLALWKWPVLNTVLWGESCF